MGTQPSLPLFDLTAASQYGGLSACFPKSRAGAYAPAVAICKGMQTYAETDIDGKLMHFVYFAPEKEDMQKALALITTLSNYNGLLLYSRGRLLEWGRAQRVLRCYSDSESCNDTRAHCIVNIYRGKVEGGPPSSSILFNVNSGYVEEPEDKGSYLFPCRLLALSFSFKFQPGHPSSEADQIQAGAVREGCDWCPNFQEERE